jgi:hypothetical protein
VVHAGGVNLTYPCVCCGYRSLTEPPGSHEICGVCLWEDDVYQLRWPFQPCGANRTSLIDAQRNFATDGASDEARRGREHADVADFERDPSWRPVDTTRDRFERRGGALAPWPEDRTVLYWWRRRDTTSWWSETTPVAVAVTDDGGELAAGFAGAVLDMAATVPQADPDNLSGMEVDFDHHLRRSPSIRNVTVTRGPDPTRQLTALCVAEPAASPQRIANEIKEVWLHDLQYQYREAHLLRTTATTVEMDVATQSGKGGYLDKLLAQSADERHFFLFARGYKEGEHYFYRLSDSHDDGTTEHVDDLVLPQGISDVWFRGRARPDGDQPPGAIELWLARFHAESGWHRYVVRIEERHLPSPNPGIADDRIPAGSRLPKDRAIQLAGD